MFPTQEAFDVMHVQGEIKIYLMNFGMPQKDADVVAGDIMHEVLTSSLPKDEYKEMYAKAESESS